MVLCLSLLAAVRSSSIDGLHPKVSHISLLLRSLLQNQVLYKKATCLYGLMDEIYLQLVD